MAAPARAKDRAHPVAHSANGKKVYAHLMQFPLSASVSANPHLLRLAEEILLSTALTGENVHIEHDMGRSIGRSELVATADTDTVFYARQTKAAGFTRFVKNRQADSTSYITIKLTRDDDGEYELVSIWIGKDFPETPDHVEATKASTSYWSSHAVIYNGQPMISSTLTKTCPY